MTSQHITTLLMTLMFVFTLSACQNKPSVDRSVDYKNARSIPSLDPSLQNNQSSDKAVKRQ